MSEQENWKWWVGNDEERYHTECDTREEAIFIASEEQEGGYIVEALKPVNIPISRFFYATIYIENAEGYAYDIHGDPEGDISIFDVPPDLCADMEVMVRSAMDEWQEKHGLTFTGFQFQRCRNHEYVPAKPESE